MDLEGHRQVFWDAIGQKRRGVSGYDLFLDLRVIREESENIPIPSQYGEYWAQFKSGISDPHIVPHIERVDSMVVNYDMTIPVFGDLAPVQSLDELKELHGRLSPKLPDGSKFTGFDALLSLYGHREIDTETFETLWHEYNREAVDAAFKKFKK